MIRAQVAYCGPSDTPSIITKATVLLQRGKSIRHIRALIQFTAEEQPHVVQELGISGWLPSIRHRVRPLILQGNEELRRVDINILVRLGLRRCSTSTHKRETNNT